MGGEHSAFRALNPSTAALLAASAQLGLARSYAASLAKNNNIASSTSTNQSPPVSPHPSESDDEEINVHEAESDTETSNPSKRNSRLDYKTPLELTKHDRN
jgi:hypothetical protein